VLLPLHLDLPEQEAAKEFAGARKKASSRVGTMCGPCKWWQCERRHYRHAQREGPQLWR
jgi:hypothetical protein